VRQIWAAGAENVRWTDEFKRSMVGKEVSKTFESKRKD
jgi:hypothetical protein